MELLGLGVGAVENGVHLANAHVHRAYKQEQEGAHGPGNPEPIVLIQLEDADYEDRDRDGEVDRAEYVAVDAGLLSKPNQLLPQQQFFAGLGVDEVLQVSLVASHRKDAEIGHGCVGNDADDSDRQHEEYRGHLLEDSRGRSKSNQCEAEAQDFLIRRLNGADVGAQPLVLLQENLAGELRGRLCGHISMVSQTFLRSSRQRLRRAARPNAP